jgi:hypothetical protein
LFVVLMGQSTLRGFASVVILTTPFCHRQGRAPGSIRLVGTGGTAIVRGGAACLGAVQVGMMRAPKRVARQERGD